MRSEAATSRAARMALLSIACASSQANGTSSPPTITWASHPIQPGEILLVQVSPLSNSTASGTQLTPVSAVNVVTRMGYYAPYTTTGDLFVDGVLVVVCVFPYAFVRQIASSSSSSPSRLLSKLQNICVLTSKM